MSHAPPAPRIVDPDPPPAEGPPARDNVCLGCAATRLADPHCASCAQIAAYCDVIVHVVQLENAQEDEQFAAKGNRLQIMFELALIGVVLAMAAFGVRTPIAYAAVLCVRVGLIIVSVSWLHRVLHRNVVYRAAQVAEDLDLIEPDGTMSPDAKGRYLDDARFIIERIRLRLPPPVVDRVPPEPTRGTDFDVPPLPPRPE